MEIHRVEKGLKSSNISLFSIYYNILKKVSNEKKIITFIPTFSQATVERRACGPWATATSSSSARRTCGTCSRTTRPPGSGSRPSPSRGSRSTRRRRSRRVSHDGLSGDHQDQNESSVIVKSFKVQSLMTIKVNYFNWYCLFELLDWHTGGKSNMNPWKWGRKNGLFRSKSGKKLF